MKEQKESISKNIEILTYFKGELEKVASFSKEEKLMMLNCYATNLFSSRFAEPISSELVVDNSTKVSKSAGVSNKTFAELIRLTKVKQHPDIVLLAAYHLMITKQMDGVTATDIEQQYGTAMLKPSSNTNAMINSNRKKGFLMEGDKKDGKMIFKITMSGVDYIESMIADAESNR